MINKILWLKDRCKTLEFPEEIWYRLKQQIQYRIIDKKWYLRCPVKNNFTFIQSVVIQKYSIDNIRIIVDATFDGIKKFNLLNTIIDDIVSNKYWNYDFKNKIQGQNSFIHSINEADYSIGEVKYVYELSRLYFLPILASYALAKEDRLLMERTKQILIEWNCQNPFLGSCAWKSGNVVGIRAINLIYFRILLSLSEEPESSEVCILLNQLIELHFKYLQSHLSLYSSKGNHFIGELAGLIAIASTYKFEDSDKLLHRYFNDLQSEILRLIYEDGFNKEQATRYQASYINLFVFAAKFAELKNLILSDGCIKRLESMIDFLNDIRISKKEFFHVGDDDSAELIYPYSDYEYNIYESILNDSAILFNKGKYDNYHFDLRNYLLLGDSGLSKYNCSRIREESFLTNYYPHSGYFLIKDTNIQLLYDVGQIGLLPAMAHGHSDILSLSLYINKRPVLVDCGSYQYNTFFKKYRDYFHGVHSHNTISINNSDQAVISRGMFWLSNPKIVVEEVSNLKEIAYCKASHYGFHRNNLKTTHTRKVFYNRESKVIEIKDLINSGKPVHVSFYLHFPPKEEVILDGESIYLRDITISNPLFKKGQLTSGDEEKPLGWYSEKYDSIQSTSSFVLELDQIIAIELNTIIKF